LLLQGFWHSQGRKVEIGMASWHHGSCFETCLFFFHHEKTGLSLVVEPIQLKKYARQYWIIFPGIGVKVKNI